MAGPTIYFIDDQTSVRHALGEMLGAYGFTVHTFPSAEEFLERIGPDATGCVVSDVRMPGMDGVELVRQVQRRRSALPIILISGHADVPMAVAAIKAGAEDMIEKPVDDAQLIATINRCLAKQQEQRAASVEAEEVARRYARLTQRQHEVLSLVVQGLSSPEIAARLDISSRTVESYRSQIMERMQADSVASLVRKVMMIDPPSV